ncbi:FAD-dependent oxidoreductase [Chitinophaga sp. YIM B06452]|uniref:FAD-dependent oxidoreductase n=1 Tax=Chitinophaga sp. YIM B06452 TaxID=3082158 RepID=UPI0031FED2BE
MEEDFDVIIAGSGAAGMTAALRAHHDGLKVLIVEKSAYYGGSTARSGGGIWVPNNYVLQREGIHDDPQKARAYLDAVAGEDAPSEQKAAFLSQGPAMLAFLRAHTAYMRFSYARGYADYYPGKPGGLAEGRTIEPLLFNGALLEEDLALLNPPVVPIPMGFSFNSAEFNRMNMAFRTWRGFGTSVKVMLRAMGSKLTGKKMLSLGQALSARLRMSMKEAGIPLWLNSPMKSLLTENGRVTGMIVEKDGEEIALRATRGVLLAAGGFERNLHMRREFMPAPETTEWTQGSPGNTGDGHLAGIAAGAALSLMDDAWWGPSVRTPGAEAFFCVAERSQPGSIMVNHAGERFTNEAAAYVDVVHEMYRRNAQGVQHIPCFFIMDQRFRNRYLFLGMFPRQRIPKAYYREKIIFKADTVDELARRINIPEENLVNTLRRFNDMARKGEDEDFHRGESAYDRYYGDPRIKPNPCLAPIDKPPFYAVEMVPGDIGTKGGLVTDGHARVLREDGTVIEGLYAAGNNAASVMGRSYAGAGATIGPAMTFGYIAALHMAGK